jgi:ribosome-binding factor A
MESTRQLKFARLIQKELGEIFQRDAKSVLEGAFITLTKVTVSPDLALAKVYVSFMMVNNKEEALKKLTVNTKVFRKLLGDKIKKQVRIIPELAFYIDDNLEYASKMDNIFSKLDIPPAPKEDEDEEDKD